VSPFDTQPLPIAEPARELVREPVRQLTPVTQPVLQLAAQPALQGDCKCPEPEAERKHPRPSRIVAKVKAFTRRMSQNSLDNLR
jgi:hypothetical protein